MGGAAFGGADADGGIGQGAVGPVLRIGVAAASPGAGASFVSLMAACSLASSRLSVSLCEPEGHYFYTALGMDRRFANRGFTSLISQGTAMKPFRLIKNEELGINWLLRLPGESRPLSCAELFRLISLPPGDVCVFDFSGFYDELLFDAMAEMDRAVLVFDTLPSKLIPAYHRAERLQLSFPSALRVVNRMNRGVHRAELKRFLGAGQLLELPSLPPEAVSRAEYNCVPVFHMPEIKKLLAEPCRELVKRLGF